MPESFGLPEVADARDEALVEERVADRALPVFVPESRQHAVEVGRLGEDVRPEPTRDPAVELEHGAVEHRADVVASTEDEPWRPEDLMEEACVRIGRPLTAKEWNKYLPTEKGKYFPTCKAYLPSH